MLTKNKQKMLIKFLKAYPALNEEEQSLINLSIQNMDYPTKDEFQEITSLTKSLQKLSLRSGLSDSGRIVLTKLKRSEWIWGAIINSRFFY